MKEEELKEKIEDWEKKFEKKFGRKEKFLTIFIRHGIMVNEITSFIRQLLTKERKLVEEKKGEGWRLGYQQGIKEAKQKQIAMEERIKARLSYCQKQNGLPFCKNCGLEPNDLL